MIIETLKTLFNRDLEKLKTEIGSYADEAALWVVDGDVTNSAGNLCQHLIGNLNGFIGTQLGHSGYVRERDLEFSNKNTPRSELLAKIDETKKVVADTFDKITEEQLQEDYPLVVFAEKMTTGWFLIHLATHLNYHLGQINYHRRIFDRAADAAE